MMHHLLSLVVVFAAFDSLGLLLFGWCDCHVFEAGMAAGSDIKIVGRRPSRRRKLRF